MSARAAAADTLQALLAERTGRAFADPCLLEEALTLLPEGDGEQRAYLLARLSVALSFLGSAERRVALAAESVAMARRLGSQPAVAHGLAAHCDAIAGPVYAEQREVESGEIVQIASELGDPALELLGLRLRVVALAEQGRLERVADDVDAPPAR